MGRIRLLGMMVLFPLVSVLASTVVRFPLDWLDVGDTVTEIVAVLSFFSVLTLLYGLVWHRDRRVGEE